MYKKPDLNAPLARLRENAAAWKANLARLTSREGLDQDTYAWPIARMEERDDLAKQIVDDFAEVDEVMTKHLGTGSAAPAAWSVTPLTDEELAAAKADWPELGMFADDTIRRMVDVVGIRMVRAMAQEAVRRAPAVLSAVEARSSK
ncbi:hypothetical protein [Streptomyces sp. SP18BB07]|uniref:hypothetical protein n=1 Tax=Streptomyces sp. SP18BB07 TaxID=3002522 RepID=UPI002E76E1DE|nr:hypothetical protein [Streptomyces sp. SP18BB07]MEE1764458.1 hypothetical protein [Streptomyces sp. SP18BB07]